MSNIAIAHALALGSAMIRFDALLYLPAAIYSDDEAFPESFNAFVEDLDEDLSDPLYACLPEMTKYAPKDDGDVRDVEEDVCTNAAETLKRLRRVGYLAQVATPVVDEDNGSWNWGFVRLQWLYADTMHSLVDVAISWANNRKPKK